jgi:hypothetical protein
MPRKTKDVLRSDKVKVFLFGVIAAMAVTLLTMFIIRLEFKERTAAENRVSLGSMAYDFSNGKAAKRTDEAALNLRNFLVETAKEDTSENCVSYYSVVLASSDEKQALLGYGCGAPSARMFAVNEGGSWRTISPTNHFDTLGIPECSHVEENKIDASIAPVCVNENLSEINEKLTYKVR